MKINHLSIFICVCISLLFGSCATAKPTQPVLQPEQPRTIESTPTVETTPIITGVIKTTSGLDSDILKEVNFFAGGAGCGFKNIGVDASSCNSSTSWPITLQVKGVFRVSDQGMVNPLPWWGDKFSSCYDSLQFGDMVYLAVKGLKEGEPIRFTIQGPAKTKSYTSIVSKDIDYVADPVCRAYSSAPSARLSWVVDPNMGIGKYTVTAEGKSGKTSLEFNVKENKVPAFGVSVGDTSLPLVLGQEKQVDLVFSKFEPDQTVRTFIYDSDTSEGASKPIRYIDIQMDEKGSANQTVSWDPSLPPGKYWFLVPSLVPENQPNPKYPDLPVEPALWGVYFFANTPPEYDPEKLYMSTQDILLRPSCGETITADAGKTINLRYGIWGVNGEQLLQETKDKIVTRLFINDQEVVGYRPAKVIPMSDMHCGNKLKNGYFLYNETQIGPFGSYSDPSELKIRVEYSFTDTITDGYDLSPKDWKNDEYTSATPFHQDFTIKLQQ